MQKNYFLLLLLMILAVDVSAQKGVSVISLVPEKSIAVVRVRWLQVRNNEKLKQVIKADSFAKVAEEIGVSEAKIVEWIIFSDISPSSSKGLGIIVSGNFTSQSVIQNAKSKDWKAEKIGVGGMAFVNPSDNSYLLPIRNGLLAFGTKSGMEKVQGVLSKQNASLITKLPFSSMWTELNANHQPISFMVGVPQEYQKVADVAYKIAAKLMNLASFGIMGTIMEKIGLVRCFGFNVSYKQSVYPTEIFAMMKDETTAWLTSGAINLLKKTPSAIGMRAKTEEDRKMLESLQTLSANSKGTLLSVKFEMPESAIPPR